MGINTFSGVGGVPRPSQVLVVQTVVDRVYTGQIRCGRNTFSGFILDRFTVTRYAFSGFLIGRFTLGRRAFSGFILFTGQIRWREHFSGQTFA